MTEHLDLDALADVLAGEAEPAHLATCARCAAELDELRAADARVQAELRALRALPTPPLPDGLADRIDAALVAAGAPVHPAATVTTLPAGPGRGASRWLPAAAAAALVLGGIGYGVSQLGGGTSSTSESAGSSAARVAAPAAGVVRNDTGSDYTGRQDLAAAVPALLRGSAGKAASGAAPLNSTRSGPAAGAAVADPLARLRADPGLSECLAALLPPEDPSVRARALDYASYKGQPAMVVVLPSVAAGKLDVFVVGPGCSRANDSVLFYASVDAP